VNNNISEDFLHYIWRLKNFDLHDLILTSGEKVEILNFGFYNTNSGPDFLNGSVRIGDMTWHGHIEMHINSSDWDKHKHSTDEAYQNVVLHVVLQHDKTIVIGDQPVPTLELKSRISQSSYNAYHLLNSNKNWIPCQSWIPDINEITKSVTLDKILAERLTIKAQTVLEQLKLNGDNWIETIYQRLLWSIGLSVNADSFLRLGQLVPYGIVSKHRDSIEEIEGLLFGSAGLLNAQEEHKYVEKLKSHYQFYQQKYKLVQMRASEWKFMRMRPSGFPTIRLAQAAKLLSDIARLDTLLFESDNKAIINNLQVTLDDGFWHEHYRFDGDAKPIKKSLGTDKINSIIINAVAPLKYAYGIYQDSDDLKAKAVEILEEIPSEKNSVIKKWKELNVVSESAATSQALLHLKKRYCDQKMCLQCSIGHQVFKLLQSA
jgi:hypothetical protein